MALKVWSAGDQALASDLNNNFQQGLQQQVATYASDTGTANVYAVTLSPAPASYAAGMVVVFKAGNASTGASTLNVNSLGAKTIKKNQGIDLGSGDIKSGQIVTAVYDGTNFQLVSPISTGSGSFAFGTISVPGGTGNQAITGVGFQPKLVKFYHNAGDAISNNSAISTMQGRAKSSSSRSVSYAYMRVGGADAGASVDTAKCIFAQHYNNGAGAWQNSAADFVSLDSDGFTINWSSVTFSTTVVYEAYG